MYHLLISGTKISHFIVLVLSYNNYHFLGGVPSELYRTDLLHRMKQGEDSDASSDDETTFVSMSDRWKEEWNHGVQVIFFLF